MRCRSFFQQRVEHGKDIISEMGKIARRYNINAAVKLQYRNLENFIHPDYRGRQDVNHIPTQLHDPDNAFLIYQ